MFAATPDTFFMRYVLSHAAQDPDRVIMIVDISVAFMHARTDENIVVKVPSDIQGTTRFWRLKAALNGTRRASKLWQDQSAEKIILLGFRRNDVHPTIFYHPDYDFQLEQHGDDFLGAGSRRDALLIEKRFNEMFMCKKIDIISMHKDDKKEGYFLKRKITVDEHGWHLELDPRYSESLIERLGLEQGKPMTTPGSKAQDNELGKPLSRQEQTEFRGAGGVAQYMAEHRLDVTFATKEALREAHAPGEGSWKKVKRIARYVLGRRRCVLHFGWQEKQDTLVTMVDADWGGCPRTRCSTSGGVARLGGHLLKHWAATQATVSLSSGESEAKAITKGCVEGLYIKHLLEQQGCQVEIELQTDSSAAKGCMGRLGCGKRMKHLEVQTLWVQQLVASGVVTITKISTFDNLADVLTKHVARAWLTKAMQLLGYEFIDEKLPEEQEDDAADPRGEESAALVGGLLSKLRRAALHGQRCGAA